LLDFGLAHREGNDKLTKSGAQLGSIFYMPPEQVLGRSADVNERSDVYSLGVTLYEMLALRPPYAAATFEAARERILEGRPEPVRALNRTISWDAETVCLT